MDNKFVAETCPLCGRIIQFGNKKLADVNGLCFNVGYSEGGWGRRQNHIEFSDEVCLECYGLLVIHVNRFVAVFESRKGCNKEQLQIVRQEEKPTVKETPFPVTKTERRIVGFIRRFIDHLKGLKGNG